MAWLAVVVLAGRVFASSPGNVPWSHQGWSTDEGLPDASVHQVFQSADGYLWLATEGGVARFDGYGFRVWRRENAPAFGSNDVSAIAEDGAGALWFGTVDGLVEMNGSTLRRFAESDGLPSSTVVSMAVADGALLVLTSKGVVGFENGRFRAIPGVPGNVSGLQVAPGGAVLLLTAGSVLRYQHGATMPVENATGIAAKGAAQEVVGVQVGPEGVVWTRSANAVAQRGQGLQRRFQTGRELQGSRVTALFVDEQGAAWIGTNRGLFWVGAGAESAVQPVEALRTDSVLSIMGDREGNFWVGTESSGLHALRPRKFRSEAAAAGEAVTTGTAAPDGTVWFGTREDGVRKVVGERAEAPISAAALTSPVVLSMAGGRDGGVWVGTPDGLNHVSGSKVQQYTSSSGLPDDFVRSVVVDAAGVVWAGTRRGLARLDGPSITTLTQAEGLGSDSIGPLLASGTGLWVGTSAGLSHVAGKRVENFLPYPDASKDVVTAIAEDEQRALWVSLHEGGLMRFADGGFRPVLAASLPREITSLAADGQGYLWIRGVRGVQRVAMAALRACADAPSRCDFAAPELGVADGMPSDSMSGQGTPAIWADAAGQLWFATRKGIAVADPAHLPVNRTRPPVVVERFLVDDAEMPVEGGEITIGAGHSRYTFDYAALSYTLPSRNRYRYMLEGFDRAWVEAGALRTASYTSLPPRQYRFRVQAANNDGVWNDAGAALRFRIEPPVYRRWWFYGLLLLLAVGLIWGVLRLRVRSVQRRFAVVLQERNRVAREIHDTLAQDFVSVSLQLDLATQMLRMSNVEGATSQLQATRKLVNEGLEAARQSIWNLRANVAEDSLPTRLTQVVKRYEAEAHSPKLKMGGAYRKLAAAVEDEVVRIAQESLANVYRHAAATEVLVQLHYAPEELQLSVRDNGRGFSLEAARALEGHYGLRGMQERAAGLGGRLRILSSPEEGTTVALAVPLAAKEDRL